MSEINQSRFSAECDALISSETMLVRSVQISDRNKNIRLEWLRNVFQELEPYTYHVDDTYFLSTADHDYDVILIGGEDAARLRKIMLANRLAFKRKLKLCVMAESTPTDRASLLSVGYDDAIDIRRVPPQEGIARVIAMWNRHCLACEAIDGGREEQKLVDELVYENTALTVKQSKILLALLANQGTPVSSFALRDMLSRDHEPAGEPYLRVFISLLRRKLLPGITITAVPQRGYALVMKAPGPRDTSA